VDPLDRHDTGGESTRAVAGELRFLADLVNSRLRRAERAQRWLAANLALLPFGEGAPEVDAAPVAGVSDNRLVSLDESVLADQRARYRAGEPGLVAVITDLVARAEQSLTKPLYSVIDKTTLPPSGDPHDYWSVAPYWWPNPNTPDGLPYVWRDGQRVPGTVFGEPGSEQFDRTALQAMIDDTTIAALAGYFRPDARYLHRGAQRLRRWFLDPATSMNPHLSYAQVRRGHGGDQGFAPAIIDAKDLYYLLDAARLLAWEGALTTADVAGLREWFAQYRQWLRHSPQGRAARAATNNVGTWYSVQLMAIDIYLGDDSGLAQTLQHVNGWVSRQFGSDGSQPEELTRTLPLHYSIFNLQGWIALAAMARRAGQSLWTAVLTQGSSIAAAARSLLGRLAESAPNEPAPNEPISAADRERLVVLAHELALARPDFALPASLDDHERDPCRVRQVFTGTEGIRPFWLLGYR
jgi:hypothetical protein